MVYGPKTMAETLCDVQRQVQTLLDLVATHARQEAKWVETLDHLNATAVKTNEENKLLKAELEALRAEGAAKDARIQELSQGNRGNNLMLFGCPTDTTQEAVLAQLAEVVPELTPDAVEVVLLPAKEGKATRPMKLCFKAPGIRLALLKGQHKLRQATSGAMRLDVDLSPAEQAERNRQWPMAARVKAAGHFWFWQGSSLRVRLANGQSELAAVWLKGKRKGGEKGGKKA